MRTSAMIRGLLLSVTCLMVVGLLKVNLAGTTPDLEEQKLKPTTGAAG